VGWGLPPFPYLMAQVFNLCAHRRDACATFSPFFTGRVVAALRDSSLMRRLQSKTMIIPVILNGAQLRYESRRLNKERFFATLRMTNHHRLIALWFNTPS
jgi:hypothetical protein